MEAIDLGTSLGQEHFGEARLGDKRRTRRLVKVADQIFQHPGGTLPEKLKGWADLSGLYRLARRPEVTHGSVLASHRARTLELMRQTSQVVLVVHDWTELDFTSKPSLADLGQIGQGGGRGYICHNSLAITPQRQVIGLAAQVLHKRRCVPKGETPAQKRQHPQRESRLWLAGCQQVGAAPPGKLCNNKWTPPLFRAIQTKALSSSLHRPGHKLIQRLGRRIVGQAQVVVELFVVGVFGAKERHWDASPFEHRAQAIRLRGSVGVA